MIRAWLVRGAGIAPLIARVTALEHELAVAKSTIALLHERAAAAETRDASATRAGDRLDGQLRILTRAVRAGAVRLRHLSATGRRQADHDDGLEKELGRLRAAMAIIESRVEAEARQSRLGTAGLLRRIETIRPRDGIDAPD